MFVSIARRMLAACGLAVLASPAAAAPAPQATPFSPVVAGIDKVCTPVSGGGTSKPAIHLYRPDDATGNPTNWFRSNPDLDRRATEAADFHGGDFVVFHEATALITVTMTHREAGMDQTPTKTSAWCFEGGKLSRATFDLILPDQKVNYRHTQYFDTDLDKPAFDELMTASLVAKGAIPTPEPSSLPIQNYHTPEDLPFYYAYEAAVDGKLPAFSVKAP